MKHFTITFLLLLCSSALNAQDFCKPTSIFFDLNKSEVKSVSENTLDSLVKSMNGADFILEIYGYTDTSNTDSYNRKLSQSRIDAVLAYLKAKAVVPKETRTFNEGEDFNSSNLRKDAAFQRRVDIYLTPMEGNDIVFKSSTGVIVKRDLSSFGDCGICAMKPKIRYLQNEADAKANGIDLITDKGEPLETYGMALFDIDTCPSLSPKERRQIINCIEMPASRWNDRVELFELVERPGNDVWRLIRDSFSRDPQLQVVRFCTNVGYVNCDVRVPPLGLILPEESESGKSFFTFYADKLPSKLHNDTVGFPVDVERVLSYFQVDKDWYLYQDASPKIRKNFTDRDSKSPNYATVYTSDYKIASPKGAIALKVKVKGADNVGYYHPDFDLFIPFEKVSSNIWYGQRYKDGFELCYIKKEKYYLEKNQAKKLKIKTKNGQSKAKLKKTYFLKKNKLVWRKIKRRELR